MRLGRMLQGMFTLCIALASVGCTPAKVKVLILDGRNNHNWKGTTPVMKAGLVQTGRFEVDVATAPEDISTYRPAFAEYDAVLSNYNGEDWPEQTQKDFVDFVSNGGGFVVVHAADNPFPNWQAYNEMIGVGGWGGRNEKSGPYLRYRDGQIVRDMSPGRGGSHGTQHDYLVDTREPDHPIMKGLPSPWMHSKDELYDRLRGPAKNLTVLATAYSDPKEKGTGEHEPVLMTIRYGKGRIFHTVLGDNPEPMKCVGFLVTLARGTEWAATGRVTLTEVPDDFPTAEAPSKRDVLAGH